MFFCVAGPGVEPGLEDYEPSVQPYTTPHVSKNVKLQMTNIKWKHEIITQTC